MRNSKQTRNTILSASGNLFNTQGYKATSISQITEATGLTKGAIYRHFDNKEKLELEALHHLSAMMFKKLGERIKRENTARDKLQIIFHFFASYLTDPPLLGGCPLMNAAVESDDTNPILRKEAQKILSVLKESLIRIIDNGKKYKQIKADVDSSFYATVIIASLEGAIMMSKLNGNSTDIHRVIKHLESQVDYILI